jgi:hypothetical protein
MSDGISSGPDLTPSSPRTNTLPPSLQSLFSQQLLHRSVILGADEQGREKPLLVFASDCANRAALLLPFEKRNKLTVAVQRVKASWTTSAADVLVTDAQAAVRSLSDDVEAALRNQLLLFETALGTTTDPSSRSIKLTCIARARLLCASGCILTYAPPPPTGPRHSCRASQLRAR